MRVAADPLVSSVISSAIAVAVVVAAVGALAAWVVWMRLAWREAADSRDGADSDAGVPIDADGAAKPSDPGQVLESLRRKLLAGDRSAHDANDSISLPFLETEPLHHEMNVDPKDAEEAFGDTVPTFSWTRRGD